MNPRKYEISIFQNSVDDLFSQGKKRREHHFYNICNSRYADVKRLNNTQFIPYFLKEIVVYM